MGCLDALVRIGTKDEHIDSPARRFAFDKNYELIPRYAIWNAPLRCVIVNPRKKVTCTQEVALGSAAVKFRIKYTACCPSGGEEKLARKLCDYNREPQAILDAAMELAARAYVEAQGEQSFFDEFYTKHSTVLKTWLPGKVANSINITIEDVVVEAVSEPDSIVSIVFKNTPVDLADNCQGVPIQLIVDMKVDATSQSRGRALRQGGDFRTRIEAEIRAFFLKVPLHRLHQHADQVRDDLQKCLEPRVREEGRQIVRLVLGLDISASQVISVEDTFSCRLADVTDLSVNISGALWIQDIARTVERGDHSKSVPLWNRLLPVLQESARELLAQQTYSKFHQDPERIWKQVLLRIDPEAVKNGTRISVNWRTAWPFDWLMHGTSVSHLTKCEIGEEKKECSVLATFDLQLEDSRRISSHSPAKENFLAEVEKNLDEILVPFLQTSRLSTYYEFDDPFQQKMAKRVTTSLEERFGLRIASLTFQRKDNLAAQNVADFVQYAPKFEVTHPQFNRVTYEMSYRVLAYSSAVGFPVYPKNIEAMTEAVKICARQMMTRAPARLFTGIPKAEQELDQLIALGVPELMRRNHGVDVKILSWIRIQLSNPLLEDLHALIYKMVSITDELDRSEMKVRIEQIARLLMARGEVVPVDELRALNLQLPEPPAQPQDDSNKLTPGGA